MTALTVTGETVVHLVLIFIVAYLLQKLLKDALLQNLPPGPTGIPFLGYLPFLGKHRYKTYVDLSKKYGAIFSIRLGRELTVVLNNYDLVKEVLPHPLAMDRHAETFAIAPQFGFVTSIGEEWHEQRSFCMQSMRDLGLGRGQWQTIIKEEIPGFLDELRSLRGEATDPESHISHTIGGNILSLLIGRRLEKGKDDDTIKLTHEFSKFAAEYFNPSSTTATFPVLLKIFTKFKIAGYDKASSAINRFLSMLQEKFLNVHKNNPEYKDVNDFINLYLQKMESKKAQGGKHYFSEQNALGNMLALFIGGNDTIVSSLLWLLRLMAKHQDVQKKVQEELDDVIGTDGIITYEDRFKVPFTFAVLLESQRYSTIAPIPGPRRAIDDLKVGKFTIPKGANISTNLWALHRDPKYWKYPHQFHPQHFLSEDGAKVIINHPSFLPFTIGRRNCPGETVAWMEILGFFIPIMQKFTVAPVPGEEVKFDTVPGIVEVLKSQKLRFLERHV